MSVELSPETEAIVNALFKLQERDEVVRLLVEECGNNISYAQAWDEYEFEDLRLCVLAVSKGNMKALRSAIEVVKSDFRELGRTGNLKAFTFEALGDHRAAQRVRRIDRVLMAIIGLSGLAALIVGASGASFLLLFFPVLLIAIVFEAMERNSTATRVRVLEKRKSLVDVLRYTVLLAGGRVWPGIAIVGIFYSIGYFLLRWVFW
jgi:hypothetical protein